MRPSATYLLAAELGFCFGPLVLLWAWGVFAVLVVGASSYFLLSLLVSGLIGMCGMCALAKIVISGPSVEVPFGVILAMVAVGISAAVFGLGAVLEGAGFDLAVSLPIVCSIHFSWLAYQRLTSR
jgi:hypothetical protein